MESFCFKQFNVLQGRSAMKVNTDGVLLAAWLSVPSQSNSNEKLEILDIGTGTGVVALIIAQRIQEIAPHCSVLAIDSDIPSAAEAGENFSASPWPDRLVAKNLSLQELASDKSSKEKFDLIATNPPYFKDSLKAPCARRSSARHNDSLPYDILVPAAFQMLKEGGRFAVVLPVEVSDEFLSLAERTNLFPVRVCRVKTVSAGKVRRVLLEFKKKEQGICPEEKIAAEESLIIQEKGDGPYTNEYRRLTGDLYLKF